MSEAALKRPRRYYLHKRRLVPILDPEAVGAVDCVWRFKQEAEIGEPLPADFPYLARLAAAFYTTMEDLDGADIQELQNAGFSRMEAELILSEIPRLLAIVPPSDAVAIL